MRGTDRGGWRRKHYRRITPARAGNRKGQQQLAGACWDHPRACGEQPAPSRSLPHPSGSPPRVRGTERKPPPFFAASGITPARAGNRKPRRCMRTGNLDHPRACGEQSTGLVFGWFVRGSPPRVRGTAPRARPMGQREGITPARAGNRLEKLHPGGSSQDHPRACGEQRPMGQREVRPQGITPARAGNRLEGFY